MPLRFLFGPVPADLAGQNLYRLRPTGQCLAFDAAGKADLTVRPTETWAEVCARLPADWRPDFIALYGPFTSIPEGLWAAPLPLVALAGDATLLWHHYRRALCRCELILTDTAAGQAFARAGLPPARAVPLYGCPPDSSPDAAPGGPRDIDLLFVGNLHPAVQRHRLAWLARLTRLGQRWRVALRAGVFGAAYRELLGRARIVFNRSIQGECNLRAVEVALAGALLFQEAGNLEVPGFFRDRQECVYYTDDNLEELLEYYLTHEEERQAIAAAGRERALALGLDNPWPGILARVEEEWPALGERSRQRVALGAEEGLLDRTWQALASTDPAGDAALASDLEAALGRQPTASLHNALGLVLTRAAPGWGLVTGSLAELAADSFRRALRLDPGHLTAGLNLVEALVGSGQTPEAIDLARCLLRSLERMPPLPAVVLDAPHFPPAYDHFRVEWERAAWENAGRPAEEEKAKRRLLGWRLHTLLADLTGDLAHHYEAVLARPDLPIARAGLGCALGRERRPAEAVPHLRHSLAGNPFDRDAARALFQALGEAGDNDGQAALALERRLLARAAPEAVSPEPWFSEAPSAHGQLASVIIVCGNGLEYTHLCLASVLTHTRPPYELILVDNGSTDGTAGMLEDVRSWPGPQRVELVRLPRNLGPAAGYNQGLARARGALLALLHNDTMVTEGWLEALAAWAVHDWPHVGLVGPVSNQAAPPQQVPADYQDRDGLGALAASRRLAFARKGLRATRLDGFCLLVRREVLERLGNFDERYGLGCLAEDDLCVRAQEAGVQLLVALNVLVHHFGGRTFAALGLDRKRQWQAGYDLFVAKWGPERTAACFPGGRDTPPSPPSAGLTPDLFFPGGGPARRRPAESKPAGEAAPPATAIPTAVMPAPPGAPRPKVSLCMIVKNEEANLGECLGSVADLVQEIIVVDTGSTDATMEIAARFGAKVFDFPWVDSFAAARNESLRHATGDWIFWLDADDRLDEPNRAKLRTHLASLKDENAAFVMKCLCLPDGQGGPATVVDHVRLFKNHPELRWEFRVHEQVLPSLRRLNTDIRWADVLIQHTGYQDPGLRGRKLQRDLRLLRLADEETPDHPFTLFNLGSITQELGRPAEALPLLRRSLERSQPGDSIVRKLFSVIAQCHRQLQQAGEALAACRAGRSYFPEDAELLFVEGMVRRGHGDREGARACLERLLANPEDSHFASVDPGIRGYKSRVQLAGIYKEEGRWAEAEKQWRAALAEQPGLVQVWLELGDLLVAQGRWPELDEVIERLEGGQPGAVEAAVYRGRRHLANGEFAAARQVLEAACAGDARNLGPRVLLSHVLLQEGKDWPGAERVLREVLALNGGHQEARNNLALLLERQGRPEEAAAVRQGKTGPFC
jgi:glycosyltransferase involved in cell wall biosynthesis/tetratricopeptide (TPR) repeat protein